MMTRLAVNNIHESAGQIGDFRARIADVPYERKGVLYSEMFFLFLCAQHVQAKRVLESGRARGQSTLLLSVIFPDMPIISIEHDSRSPDVAIAKERLRGHDNVDLRFGDAKKILPAIVQAGDIVLIDGPKGFGGLRLALRLLATRKPSLVFIHDTGVETAERAFLSKWLPGTLYSDSIDFANLAHSLDTQCWSDIPPDRRLGANPAPAGYGFGLACLPLDPAVSYRCLLARATFDGFVHRNLKRFSPYR